MKPLVCDICGGDLVVQAGGEKAVCSCCGIQYSLERIREKVLEIRGTVRVEGTVQTNQTGSREDVDQWRKLLEKYYAAGDFQSANQIVKKILEAIPNDPQANQMYDDLQVLKDLEVNNGTLVKYHGSAASITIPSCVKIIGPNAFKDRKSLEHIILSNTVEQIQGWAFSGCTNLQTIDLPETVKSIGGEVFSGCTSLINITIPGSVKSIANKTFNYCSSLTNISIPDSVKSIGDEAFNNCSSLTSISIPNSVESIGDRAFRYCTSLTNITIPDSVESIGDRAFYGCTALINVLIPDRLVSFSVFSTLHYDDYDDYLKHRCPWYENYEERKKIENWKSQGLCQHCGGMFSFWTNTCKKCGRITELYQMF